MGWSEALGQAAGGQNHPVRPDVRSGACQLGPGTGLL